MAAPSSECAFAVLNYTDPRLGDGEAAGEYCGFRAGAPPSAAQVLRDVRLPCACAVRDGRGAALTLASAGFELRHLGSAQGFAVSDDAEVLKSYVPQIEKLVWEATTKYLLDIGERHTQIREVAVWDLSRRSATNQHEIQNVSSAGEEHTKLDSLAPVPLVHADFHGAAAAHTRLQQLVANGKDTLNPIEFDLKLASKELLEYAEGHGEAGSARCSGQKRLRSSCSKRFLSINVWRSTDIGHVVEDDPLALCVPESIVASEGSSNNLVPFNIHCPDVQVTETHFAHPHLEGGGAFAPDVCGDPEAALRDADLHSEGMGRSAAGVRKAICAAQTHEWYWFPAMSSEEVVLFIQHGGHHVWGVPHTSFKPIAAPGSAARARLRPRQSIEARIFVFLEDSAPDPCG